MKTIGLIGGMSWESTQTYYRLINQHVRDALGGLHSAKVVLYSVDFAEIEALQHQGDWQATAEILGAAGKSVEAAGADFLVLCTNTMHKVAEPLEAAVSIPLLHIADATAQVLQQQGVGCVGLLGTRFTMEQAFYIERLQRHGIEVVGSGPRQHPVRGKRIVRPALQRTPEIQAKRLGGGHDLALGLLHGGRVFAVFAAQVLQNRLALRRHIRIQLEGLPDQLDVDFTLERL